jgi:hypothetical protein
MPTPTKVDTSQIDKSTPTGKAMADSMAISNQMLANAMMNMEEIQKNTQEFMTKSLSPFTAATGDKAKAIIKEMFYGRNMIYRTVGYNQANSTEGEVIIDDSFRRAMEQIGMTKDMF